MDEMTPWTIYGLMPDQSGTLQLRSWDTGLSGSRPEGWVDCHSGTRFTSIDWVKVALAELEQWHKVRHLPLPVRGCIIVFSSSSRQRAENDQEVERSPG